MDEKNLKSEDYIDVSGLKGITFQILDLVFSFFRFLVSPLYKSKVLLIAGALAGLLAGFAYYYSKPPYYEVSMIIQSSHVNNITVSELVRQLNILVHSESTQNARRELNLNEEQSKEVLRIDTRSLANESLTSDTSEKLLRPFKIIAQIKENKIADTLQNAIVAYLSNKPFLKKIIENERKINLDKLSFIEGELEKLDSLKIGYNRFLAYSKMNATFYNNALNPADIYSYSSDLVNQKEVILKWLNRNSEAFTVIDGFKSSRVKQSVPLRETLLVFVAMGFGISFLIGLFVEMEKKLRNASY